MGKLELIQTLRIILLLSFLAILPACEHLPWDKKEEDANKKDNSPLFTKIAPKPIKRESIKNEEVDTLYNPGDRDMNALKKSFPPSTVKPPPPPPKHPVFYEKFLDKNDKTKYPVNFEWDATSIRTMVSAFAAVLNFSYTIDPAVKGAIDLRVRDKDGGDIMMTKREIWQMFDQVLWMVGAYASLEGNILHIKPYSQMPKEHRIFVQNPPKANVAVRLIPIKNIAASTVIAQIQDFLSDGAKVSEVTGENKILLVEDPENIEKITTLIEQLDTKEREDWPRAIIRCTNVSASRIKTELETLLPILGFNVTVDKMEPAPGSIHIGSVERLQVLVASAANEEAIDIVKKWVTIMDRSDVGEQERVYVYKVVSSTAEELLQSISTIFNVEGTYMAPNSGSNTKLNSTYSGGSSSTASRSSSKRSNGGVKNISSQKSSTSSADDGPATVFEVPVKVFADGSHNRLIIRTTPRTYSMLKALLARIDSMPPQVLMQIMIAEATLNNNTQYGLEFSGEALNDTKWLGLLGTQYPGLNPSKPKDSTDAGFQYYLQSKNSEDKFAYIRALAGKGNTKILSSPQLLVKSGTTASIDVGRDIPTITKTQTDTTNVSTSNEVEYRKIGVLLSLTPTVTEGGLISLDVDQEVSQLGPNITAGNAEYPSFLQRHVVTTLAIRNGGTIIMGGIIDEVTQDNNSSAPVISEIPILSQLLGYTDNQSRRTELLMMLTGSIVDEKTSLQKVIQRYKKAVAMFRKFKKDSAPNAEKN